MKFESIKEIFKNINTEKKLESFLIEKDDDYCKFILSKKAKAEPTTGRIEMHHIIPLHAGGPEFEAWNKIKLSFEDHTHAHFLLASCYKSQNDNYVYIWRSGLTQEARRKQRKYAQTKSVFLDPNMQSEFGKKGGRVWNERRLKSSINKQSYVINQAFSNGMIWYIKSKNTFIQINPSQFNLLSELVIYLKSFSLKTFTRATIKKSLPNALSKVLSGQSIQACNEFYLVGVFTLSFKNKNARLDSYYKVFLLSSQGFLKYSYNTVSMRNSLTKNLPKRSMSRDAVINLLYPTLWYNKSHNKTLEIPPVKTIIALTTLLENSINTTYSQNQKKQISALIRGGWIGRTRVGWTLLKINSNLK